MEPIYTKTIVCLANSRKVAGRCVAGKEIVGGTFGVWVRPISARPAGELSEEERRFRNGQDPKLLDVVTISMLGPRPLSYQSENHLIDNGYYWIKEGEATSAHLSMALDRKRGLLWDNSSSSYNGLHDRVGETTANRLDSSLRLIEVRDFRIVVGVEGEQFRKRKLRGLFTFERHPYRLSVTDPVVERRFLAGADGDFKVGHAILCISLGEPFEGYAYKLIAAVFEKH